MLPQELNPSIVLSSREHNWKGLEITQFKNAPNPLVVPPLTNHAILLHLGTPLYMAATIGESEYLGILVSGGVSIVPAYTASSWCGRETWCPNVLLLSLDVDFLQEVAIANRFSPARRELAPIFNQSDPQIKHIGLALKAELELGCEDGQSFVESMATALALHVLRRYSTERYQRSDRPFEAATTKIKLQQLVDYIDEHAVEDLNLAGLAEQLGLSQSYFARQFKKLTGVSPYQYILQCRVERAKQLLQKKELTITEVALRSGFRDQNHLTKVFRRVTAMTPKAFQQNC